jgi:hypothetical protein
MKYANAAKIFPQPLLDEMRKYFPFGMLWMPRHEFDRSERAELVTRLIENGVPVKEVAALAELSARHAYRLAGARGQKMQPDSPEPESAPAVSLIRAAEGDDAR